MILDDIVAHKGVELAERAAREPLDSVAARAAAAPAARDFRAALAGTELAVIAEIKRISPASGALRPGLDAAETAARYAEAGAAAISVLTDEHFFGGSDRDLAAVRRAVRTPVLRKDFVIDPYQVHEARALGADAVLLIVRALGRSRLAELVALVESLGMAALVEVHTVGELTVAADLGASLIGINNRDLTRMTVDLDTTARLRPLVPPGVTVVAESGIRTAEDAHRLRALGVDAILVGEALVTAEDPAERLRELVAAGRAVVGAGVAR